MMKCKVILIIILVSLTCLMLPAMGDVDSSTSLSSVGCQARETELGDLTADAVRAAANTPVALIPAGSMKEVTIPGGKVKTEDVLKCLQYPADPVVVIEITGAQLLQALERSVSIHPQKNMGFLQVSGLSFTFDPDAGKGAKVSSVTVGKVKLASDQKYKVATTRPLADGAYGYFTIWGKSQTQQPTSKTMSQAVTDFLSSKSSVDYHDLNRIVAK